MKTTIDIATPLLNRAKHLAAEEERTLRDVVEEALRRLLDEKKSTPRFRLKRGSFRGHGLQAGIQEGDWEAIRGLIYRA